MRLSVRCHAVVDSCGVHKNAVVSFSGSKVPRFNERLALIAVDDVSVTFFTGEMYSTVDYNGISVIGNVVIDDIILTVNNISDVLRFLSTNIREGERAVISFIPFTL